MTLEPWQWALAVGAAIVVGISKTGVAGLSMLSVVVFAQILPAREATGVVLPLLIVGDIVAVKTYRRHVQWSHLWRLFPWTVIGVVLGYFTLDRINDSQARRLIGLIVMGLSVLHAIRRSRRTVRDPAAAAADCTPVRWLAPVTGVLAGFTTLVANAAGPLMTIFLLAMRLPKLEFFGTAAVFFFLLNLFKVPFMIHLSLITPASFRFNLILAPAVLLGAYLGGKILPRMNQRIFENLALVLAAAAGLRLLF